MKPYSSSAAAAASLLFSLFLTIATAQLAFARQGSQQDVYQSSAVVRANTRLVVVDVVATDSKGQPVSGLKPEDFSVLENGAAQKISNFTFHEPAATPVTAQAPALPPNVISNAPQFKASSLNVMLIDTFNGDFAEQAYMKEQLEKYLAGTKLVRPMAIFALQERVQMLHDFTTDSGALKTAVEKFRPPARINNADSLESRASAFTTHGSYHTSDRNIESTLNELNALAKTLAGYPGRKNLIWLSESFPLSLFPESMQQGQLSGVCNGDACGGIGGSMRSAFEGTGAGAYKDYALLIKKVADSLMNAQVAVYVVDAGAVGKDSRLASQATGNEIAERTGGKAFHNSNDLAGSMSTSVEDGSTYYTLEYYPQNKKWDGQFRTIEVKTARPGVKLRYRQGYYALDPQKINKDEADKVAENFSRALQVDAPAVTAVLFQAGVVPPSVKNRKVVVNFAIDPHTLLFQNKDGMENAKVTCTVWAYGKDKEKPKMSSGDTVNASLKPDVYQQVMKQYFPCKQELDLKPGTYTLRLGVLDRTTNLMGTTNAMVTVP